MKWIMTEYPLKAQLVYIEICTRLESKNDFTVTCITTYALNAESIVNYDI